MSASSRSCQASSETEVTDVLIARDHLPDPEPFRTMIVWSFAAHLAALVLLLLRSVRLGHRGR